MNKWTNPNNANKMLNVKIQDSRAAAKSNNVHDSE